MKKHLLLVLTICCLSGIGSSVWAVPAQPNWQKMDQPDGSVIELRTIGDEFYHYWINRDGQEVKLNEDGYWVVVTEQPTSAQRKARRMASAQLREVEEMRKAAVSPMPTKMLVILVSFKDVTMNAAHDNAYFDDWLNGEDHQPYGSVWEYFNTTSDGKYSPHWDVIGPVVLDSTLAYYGGNDDEGEDLRPRQMAFEACEKADALGCDFTKYDQNSDGTVDNVYIIYAGYSESSCSHSIPNSVWPHSWNMGSYATHQLDGKKVSKYACSAELDGCSGNNVDGIGTFCHEFSHTLGLPDYYDTKYGQNYTNDVTPNGWSLMDHGSYNGSGHRPPLYSIFDKCYMGWSQMPPVLPKNANLTVEMPVGTQYAKHITGTTSAKNYTSTDTIYYLENRQQSGKFDGALPGHGLLIWKVIYRSSWSTPNNETGAPRYTLLSATGSVNNIGTKKDSYPGYNKVTSKTIWPGCQLNAIKESNSIISFNFNGGAAAMTTRDESFQIAQGQSYTWRGHVLNQPGVYRDTARSQYGDTAITFTLSYVDPDKAIIYTAPNILDEVKYNTSCGLHPNAFDQTIDHHYFSNGIGLIAFKGTLHTVEDYAFYGCRKGNSDNQINTLTLPKTVTKIGNYAFYCCYETTHIDLGTSVQTIGNYALYKCNKLQELTLPETVTSLGKYALQNCTTLVAITSENLTPPTCQTTTFKNVTKKNVTLNVYPASVSSYKKATEWKDFYIKEIACGGQPTISLIHDTICQGNVYVYKGQNYSTFTSIADTTWNTYGCIESIDRLELRVNNSYAYFEKASTCADEPYQWHNQTLSKSGSYYCSYTTIDGCDSIYRLELTVQPTYLIEYNDNETIYEGDSLEWRGKVYSQEGIYTDTIYHEVGCDTTTYQLTLTVLPKTTTPIITTHDTQHQSNAQIFIYRDHLYIERNGELYDAAGRKIRK